MITFLQFMGWAGFLFCGLWAVILFMSAVSKDSLPAWSASGAWVACTIASLILLGIAELIEKDRGVVDKQGSVG